MGKSRRSVKPKIGDFWIYKSDQKSFAGNLIVVLDVDDKSPYPYSIYDFTDDGYDEVMIDHFVFLDKV